MESFKPMILLLFTGNSFLFCGKDNFAYSKDVFPDVQIMSYDFQRDNKQLKDLIGQCEDELETNWYTCKNYRFTSDYITYVVRSNQKLVGFICYQTDHTRSSITRGQSHIELLAIAQQFRHQGYGRQLLRYTLNELNIDGMEQTTIHVPIKNTIARVLYESEGFKFSGRYASNGTILPILVKKLQ